ncbi:hypothetical protein Lal_00019136 [Lupinus albus]|nr:hypothetical protein Lal_00019136 [Lupinus albus]
MNVSDSEFQDLVPKGTHSLLVQPMLQISTQSTTDLQKPAGFILLASTVRYAFSIKDRAWIAAVADKLRAMLLECVLDFILMFQHVKLKEVAYTMTTLMELIVH